MEQPTIRRNQDGTFPPGVSGNPSGRTRNSLKDYIKRKLAKMTDEEKEQWLVDNHISGEMQFRMAEGNPKTSVDGGEDENGNPLPLLGGLSNGDYHNGNSEITETEEED